MTQTILRALALLCLICLAASACAPGPNELEKTPGPDGRIAGFFMGLWQGFIAPVTFIISAFTKSVRLYEVHNNGFLYNFGFVIGAGLFLSGGIFGRRRKPR